MLQVRKQLKAVSSFKSGKRVIGFYDTKDYQRLAFEKVNKEKAYDFEFLWISEKLSNETVSFAQNCDAVCCFVNDDVGTSVLETLNEFVMKRFSIVKQFFEVFRIDYPYIAVFKTLP